MQKFALISVASVAAQQCQFEQHDETCFAGTTIVKKNNVASVGDCCVACQEQDGCTHFTLTGTTCGLKSGTPVNPGKHTHCTSGVLGDAPSPGPSPPTTTPAPAPPAPTTPAPTPPTPPTPGTSGVKYQVGGQCLGIGARVGTGSHVQDDFHLKLTDCDTAPGWQESITGLPKALHSQIAAPHKQSSRGEVCLRFSGNGKCKQGLEVIGGKCENDIDGEAPVDRFFWDASSNAIASDFCKNYGLCLDFVEGNATLKPCAGTSTWTRHGPANPPVPPTPRPDPAPPAPAYGRYHLKWPLPGTVAGVGESGYPEYFGNNNAEICPEERKTDCSGGCKCLWPMGNEVPLYHGDKAPGGPPVQMTRSQIVQRAIVWVANGWDENNEDKEHGMAHGIEGCAEADSDTACPQYWHGGACCAFPSMARNITGCIKSPGSHGVKINCEDMRPGDGISMHGKHVALFAKWVDKKKKQFKMFEFKGKARISDKKVESGVLCMKRKNLIEDVEPENIAVPISEITEEFTV